MKLLFCILNACCIRDLFMAHKLNKDWKRRSKWR